MFNSRNNKFFLVILFALLPILLASTYVLSFQTETKTVTSPQFHVDKIYDSMEGPKAFQKFTLLENEPRQLLWITGYESKVFDAENPSTELKDFMCHSNLDLDMAKHRTLFNWKKNPENRLFTLSEGRQSIKFPKGFGVPIYSDEVLQIFSQALNHNIEKPDVKIKIENNIYFIRDSQLTEPIKPLFMSATTGMVLIKGKDGYYNVPEGHPHEHGHGSSWGINAEKKPYTDNYGREFSVFWVVPPGRHVYRTLSTQWMNIPFDTRAHYISAHVHPFAESIALRDLKTGEIIFESSIKNKSNKIGLVKVSSLSSEEGVPLYQDREYELISIYNNTSGKYIGVMSVLFLYLQDMEMQN
ncbi:MAG: hypothetical protein ACQ9MH_03230 [Nitrospinales bacterium]